VEKTTTFKVVNQFPELKLFKMQQMQNYI